MTTSGSQGSDAGRAPAASAPSGAASRQGPQDIRRNDLAQMLDGAVHDFRTPLGAISGWLEVLESELDEAGGVVGKAFAGLRRAVDEQVRLVQQLGDASAVLHEDFDPARRARLVDRLLAAASRLDPAEHAWIDSLGQLRGRSSAECIDGGDRLDDGLHVFLRLLAMAAVDGDAGLSVDGDDEGLVVRLLSRQHAAESLLAFCNGLNRSAAKRSSLPLPLLWAARTALIDSGLEPGARVARRASSSVAGSPQGAAGAAPDAPAALDAEPQVDMIVWLRIADTRLGTVPSQAFDRLLAPEVPEPSVLFPPPADDPALPGTPGTVEASQPADPGQGRPTPSPGVAALGALAAASPFTVAPAPGTPAMERDLNRIIDAGVGGADLAGSAMAGSGLGGSVLGVADRNGQVPGDGMADGADEADAAARMILVVDDQKEIREMLALWLRCHQFQVVVAGSAREARQRLAESGDVRAALIDIRMPDEDGISLLRSIRDRENERGGRRMPALAITGQPSTETRTSAIEAGFSGMLAKPLKLRQLIALVENLR